MQVRWVQNLEFQTFNDTVGFYNSRDSLQSVRDIMKVQFVCTLTIQYSEL